MKEIILNYFYGRFHHDAHHSLHQVNLDFINLKKKLESERRMISDGKYLNDLENSLSKLGQQFRELRAIYEGIHEFSYGKNFSVPQAIKKCISKLESRNHEEDKNIYFNQHGNFTQPDIYIVGEETLFQYCITYFLNMGYPFFNYKIENTISHDEVVVKIKIDNRNRISMEEINNIFELSTSDDDNKYWYRQRLSVAKMIIEDMFHGKITFSIIKNNIVEFKLFFRGYSNG